MGKEKFEEYLKSQGDVVDWELKKEEWIKEIEQIKDSVGIIY